MSAAGLSAYGEVVNVYRYTAVSGTGERSVGVVNGADEQTALAELERRRLTPISLELDRKATQAASSGSGSGRLRVRAGRLGEAYVQISELLQAGVPLLRTLRLIGSRKSNPKMAQAFEELADAVEDGEALHDAMARRPGVFKPVHVAVIRAGERGGFLESSFRQVGEFVTGQAELRQSLIDHMIYPLVILNVLVVGLILMFTVYIPQFRDLFIDIELPAPTLIAFAISTAMTEYGMATFIGLAISAAILWRVMRDERVRTWRDAMLLRTPLLGAVSRSLAVARFCRVLGTLLGNGVGLIAALEIARDAVGFRTLAATVDEATEAVRAGEALADPLQASGVFDDEIIEMIRMGESANNLDAVLVRVAEAQERQVARKLGRLMKLVEPMMILLLAVAVLFVALALILPMLQLTSRL